MHLDISYHFGGSVNNIFSMLCFCRISRQTQQPTMGSYGPNALDFIKDVGCRIKESTGEKHATSYLMQAIGIAIQRGNSQCILGTVKDSRKIDEIYYL